MKKKEFTSRILITLIIAIMLFSLTACFNDNVHKYTLSDIKTGETFEITLQDPHADGGWRWKYEIASNSGVEYVSEKFISDHLDDPDWCGAGGERVLTFKAVKAGQYRIKFVYVRFGENEPPLETNIYNITVSD